MTLCYNDMSEGYLDLRDDVLSYGTRSSPRGLASTEITGAHFILVDPTKPFPHGIGRKYGLAIAVAEALQLIAGTTDPQLMISVGSNFARFLDGGNLEGAYGPRIRNQLPQVHERLRADRDTRQALMTIWDPARDCGREVPKDLPCTISLWFKITAGKLELHVTMRSNDLFWGTAHDVPMFTLLQLTMADALGIPAGHYHHHAYSLHIYDRDLDAFEALGADGKPSVLSRPPWKGIQSPSGIEQGMKRARQLLSGETLATPSSTELLCETVICKHVDRAEKTRRDLL
jgi:thymidylate synthase